MGELATLKEVAAYLRVATRTVHRLIEREELKATKVGSDIRIKSEWVQDYLDRQVMRRKAAV
jgi:excisionase family DNA binding protein